MKEIQQEDHDKKEEQQKLVRLTLPKHTQNKLALFEKQKDVIVNELEELKREKQQLIEDNDKKRLEVINYSIDKKEAELRELDELIAPIKLRVEKQALEELKKI